MGGDLFGLPIPGLAYGRPDWARPSRPEPGAAEFRVRIVAALVNPPGPASEVETSTLLNSSPHDVDLAGWSILDREKRQLMLHAGSLPAGETLRVVVGSPVQPGNRGGLITLLDPDGLTVDGVAYNKSQAAAEGWSIVF